ncbi:phage head-tail connector protein [Macrococcus capreoli]|uniref:phage head-tail connector protein n=1 Tax=Macrococcus capreoli TaxID=2982690 RepID=UPI003EE4B0F9
MQPSEVIAINQWEGKSFSDEKLLLLIDLYRGIAEEYCNDLFPIDEEPDSVKKFIAQSIKFNDIDFLQAESMGSVSYTYKSDAPQHLYRLLSPFKKLRW